MQKYKNGSISDYCQSSMCNSYFSLNGTPIIRFTILLKLSLSGQLLPTLLPKYRCCTIFLTYCCRYKLSWDFVCCFLFPIVVLSIYNTSPRGMLYSVSNIACKILISIKFFVCVLDNLFQHVLKNFLEKFVSFVSICFFL